MEGFKKKGEEIMSMLIRGVSALVALVLLATPVFADNADKALAALKAKKDKDVAALVQGMAMDADFVGLDKVREAAPDVFDAKYFPSEFVSSVIFKYVETKASQKKPVAPAKPVTVNPNKKGTWQYVMWDLQKVYPVWQKETDPTKQAKLKAQVDQLGTQLQALMQNMPQDQQLQVGIALALLNYADQDGQSSGQSTLEAMNAQFAKQALDILQYLFQVGIPFPATLPKQLPLSDWQREVAAFDFYIQITDPTKKGEFESDAEFAARKVEVARLNSVIFTTELTLPVALTLAAYNTDEQYFPLMVGLGETRLLPNRNYDKDNRASATALALADVRFYVPRKNAQFFKDKTFASWNATAILQASQPGDYSLKELKVKTPDGLVTENLWGVMVAVSGVPAQDRVLTLSTYFPGREVDVVAGEGSTPVLKITGNSASLTLAADGNFRVVTATEGGRVLWQKSLTQKATWLIPAVVVPLPSGRFLMGTTEVTQAQYSLVVGTNPSRFTGDSLPVEQVSWYDAVKFCNLLSRQEGLTSAYDGKGNPINGANGWRLPTEAEWEFAAEGGNPTNPNQYSGSNTVDEVAWYYRNSDSASHPVATKKPNELGLYDMSGNVWEWCNDVVSGSARAYRGGSLNDNAGDVRVASWNNDHPGGKGSDRGFRVVRSQSGQ